MKKPKQNLHGVEITEKEELLSAQAVAKALKRYQVPSPDKQAMIQDTLLEYCKVKKKGLRREDPGVMWELGKRTVWKHENMTPQERHYTLEHAANVPQEIDDREWGDYDEHQIALHSLFRHHLEPRDRPIFAATISDPFLTDEDLATTFNTTHSSIQKSRSRINGLKRSFMEGHRNSLLKKLRLAPCDSRLLDQYFATGECCFERADLRLWLAHSMSFAWKYHHIAFITEPYEWVLNLDRQPLHASASMHLQIVKASRYAEDPISEIVIEQVEGFHIYNPALREP